MAAAGLDAKLVAREKKIFDVSAKPKDRMRLLMTLDEDGFRSQDTYARRGNEIVLLCEQHVAAMANAKFSKGKVVAGLEVVKPFLDVVRRVVITQIEAIRKQEWNVPFFSDVVERAVHVDAPPAIRRAGVNLLLLLIDAVRPNAAHAPLLNLLFRVVDWGAITQMSDPSFRPRLPPGTHLPNELDYDFMQKRAAPAREDLQRETLEHLKDIADHIATRTDGDLQFWWQWFTSKMVPMLYPKWTPTGGARHGVHAAELLRLAELEGAGAGIDGGEDAGAAPRQRGPSRRTDDSTSKVVGVCHRVHRIVVGAMLPLAASDATCGIIVATRDTAAAPMADLELVLEVLGASFLVLTPDDSHLAYRIARLFYDWLVKPSRGQQQLLSASPEYITGVMATTLTKLFLTKQEDLQPTPSLLNIKTAMFELACDFFIAIQSRRAVLFTTAVDTPHPRLHVGFLKLWLDEVVTPVFKAADKDVHMYEAAHELVSWALYVQWVIAHPSVEECQVMCPAVHALTTRTKTSLVQASKTAVHCVPTTTCAVFFTNNPLVLHWRALVINLLRRIIGAVCVSGGGSIPDAFPPFCREVRSAAAGGHSFGRRADRAATAAAGRVSPPPSPALHGGRAKKTSITSVANPVYIPRDAELLDMHQARQAPLAGGDSLSALVAPLTLPQLTVLWVNLFQLLATPAPGRTHPAAQPPPVFLTIVHTVSDIVSDLLYSMHAYRFYGQGTAKKADRRQDIPRHVELLFHLPRHIPSLTQAAIPADTLAELAMDVLLAGLDPNLPREFQNAGGAHMALASLCDLLALGLHMSDVFRDKACTAVVNALGCQRMCGMPYVPVYRLFPLGLFAPGTPMSHVFLTSQASSPALLAPLALAATFYIGSPPQTHLAAQYPGLALHQAPSCWGVGSSETTVRCAAVGVVTWCTAVVVAAHNPTDPVAYPAGYTPPSPHPRTYRELTTSMADALRRLVKSDQPAEARIMGLHGLGLLLLLCITPRPAREDAGGDGVWVGLNKGGGTYSELLSAATHDVGLCLLDADSGVAAAAVSVYASLVDALPDPGAVPGLAEALATALATALLSALAEYKKHRKPRIALLLIQTLLEVLGVGVPRDARVLAISALSYAAYSRVSGGWFIPRMAVLRRQAGYTAFPVQRCPGYVVPPDYVAVGMSEDQDETVWWGEREANMSDDDDEWVAASSASVQGTSPKTLNASPPSPGPFMAAGRSPGTPAGLGDGGGGFLPARGALLSAAPSAVDIRQAAGAALEHYLVHFEHYPNSAHDRAASHAAPDVAANPTAENMTMLCSSGRALVSLTRPAGDAEPLLLTSRTQMGCRSWLLKRVVTVGDSLFETKEHTGYGHNRSMSGAVVGRVRTQALHATVRTHVPTHARSESASGSLGPGMTGEDLLQSICDTCTPEYITAAASGRMQQDSPWMERFKKQLAAVPDVDAAADGPVVPALDAHPPAASLATAASIADAEALLPRHASRRFLATGPLLDFHAGALPYPVAPQGGSATRLADGGAAHHDPCADTTSNLSRTHGDAALLPERLGAVDALPERDTFTCAVLYAGAEQTTETAVLDNHVRECSPQYLYFLQGLGWLVDSDNHRGFRGGVVDDEKVHADIRYHASPLAEMVFHICTSVTAEAREDAVHYRRRMIARDAVHVVWNEADTPYPIGTTSTAGSDVWLWIILSPVSNGIVCVSLCHRAGTTAPSGPLVDGMAVPLHLAGPLVRAHVKRALATREPRAVAARRAAIRETASMFKKAAPSLSEIVLPMFA